MTRDIDRKLRLTAALLGIPARKDLAAAFRRVNPNTTFDVTRADKWLHGRAKPRDPNVYEDWSKLLRLDRPGHWIASCEYEDFLAEVAALHRRDPEELRRRLDAQGRPPAQEAPGLALAGTYAGYTHAWSPYFRGRLIRAGLVIGAPARSPSRAGGRADQPSASYAEILPTGRLQARRCGRGRQALAQGSRSATLRRCRSISTSRSFPRRRRSACSGIDVGDDPDRPGCPAVGYSDRADPFARPQRPAAGSRSLSAGRRLDRRRPPGPWPANRRP